MKLDPVADLRQSRTRSGHKAGPIYPIVRAMLATGPSAAPVAVAAAWFYAIPSYR
jgi:hypothetical protein